MLGKLAQNMVIDGYLSGFPLVQPNAKFAPNVSVHSWANLERKGGHLPPPKSGGVRMPRRLQGLLPPRMITAQRNAILSPAPGLVVFNTEKNLYKPFY